MPAWYAVGNSPTVTTWSVLGNSLLVSTWVNTPSGAFTTGNQIYTWDQVTAPILNSISNQALFQTLPLASIGTNALAGLDPQHTSWLTDQQIKALTADQVGCLGHPDWLNTTAVGALTDQQVQKISISWQWMTSDFLNALTQKAFQAIPTGGLAQLTNTALAGLDATHTAWITDKQVRALSPNQIFALMYPHLLNTTAAGALSDVQVQAIGCWRNMSGAVLNALTQKAFQAIPTWAIAQLTTQALAGLDATHASWLSAPQLAALDSQPTSGLTDQQIKVLTADQVGSLGHPDWLNTQAVGALTDQQVQKISISWQWMSSDFLNAMSQKAFQAIPTAGIAQLLTQALGGLGATHASWLTQPQLQALSGPQLAALQPAAFQALPHLEWLNAQQTAAITAPQIQALSPDQIASLASPDQLNTQAVGALSAPQVARINSNRSWIGWSPMTSGFLNALSLPALQAIPTWGIPQLGNNVLRGLDANHASGFNQQQLLFLSKDQWTALTQAIDWSHVSSDFLNALPIPLFQAIPLAAIPQLSNTALAGLDLRHTGYFTLPQLQALSDQQQLIPQQIQLLTPDQIGALAHPDRLSTPAVHALLPNQVQAISISWYWMSGAWLNALTKAAFQSIPIAVVQQLTAATTGGLDADHVSWLKVDQFGALAHPDWLNTQAVHVLTPDQVKAIGISWSWMSSDFLNALTQTAFQAIPNTGIAQLTNTALGGLDANHTSWLTVPQLGALTTDQRNAVGWHLVTSAYLNSLTQAAFQAIPNTGIAQLTPNALAGLDATHASWLLPAQQQALSGNQLGALQPASFKALPHLEALSGSQTSGITDQQIQALTPDQVHALGHSDWLSTTAVHALTADQVKAIGISWYWMSSDFLNALTQPAFQAIPTTAIAQLTPTALAGLDAQHGTWLTGPQLQAFSDQQLTALSPVAALNLMPAAYAALGSRQQLLQKVPALARTPAQLAALTPQDISSLSPAVIAAFSPMQLAALGPKLKSLSGAQDAALTASQLNGLPPQLWSYFLANANAKQSLSVQTLQNVNSAVVQILNAAGGNAVLTAAQNAALANATLASVAGSAAGVLASSPTARAVYSMGIQIQTLSSLLNTWAGNSLPNFVGSAAANLTKALATLYAFTGTYTADAQSTKDSARAVRLIGSMLGLSAMAAAITNATLAGNNGMTLSIDIVQAAAILASSLQVPVSMALQIIDAYNDNNNEDGLATLISKKSHLTDFFNALSANDSQKITTAVGQISADVFTDDSSRSQTVSSGSSTADLTAKPTKTAYLPALRSNAVFLVADLVGLGSGILGIVAAAQKGDTFGIVNAAVNSALSVGFTAGDFLNFLTATQVEQLVALAGAASVVLGVTMIASIAWNTVSQLVTDLDTYAKSPTTGNEVAVFGDLGGNLLKVGIVVVGMAIGGPIGAGIGMLAGLLVPNFAAIGQAIDLANKWTELDSQGRTVEGDLICYQLHAIAALNAVPLVSLFSFAYTGPLMNQLYAAMQQPGGMQQAILQDFQYQMKSSGATTIQTLQQVIQGSTTTRLTDILCLTQQSADEQDYYANPNSAIDYFISQLDVTANAYTAQTTALARGSSNSLVQALNTLPSITLQDSGSGLKIVTINAASGANAPFVVDASSASESMVFILSTGLATIWGGSTQNLYQVDSAYRGYTIHGGSSGNDIVQMTTNDPTGTDSFSLDGVFNAQVLAPANATSNTVTGTQSGQTYQYAGGADKVSMTGGHGTAMVGGQGTTLVMSGGNNAAYVVLGYKPQGNNPGSYTGGAAATPTANDTGENTINFTASVEALNFQIFDPAGQMSGVTTQSGPVADSGRFTGFQNIVGSNLGDNLTISNCTTLDEVTLGTGSNLVQVRQSTGLTLSAAAGSANQIWLNGSSNVWLNTVYCASQVWLFGSSSLNATLGGTSDTVDASMDAANASLNAFIATGAHTLLLNNQHTQVVLEPGSNDSTTVIYDASGRQNSLLLELGTDMTHEWLTADATGLHIFSSDGSNQRLDYAVGSPGAPSSTALQTASHTFIETTGAPGSFTSESIGVDLLVQAMAALGSLGASSLTFQGQAEQGFSLAALSAYVIAHHPGAVQAG